jgi:hypothetical protein
MVRRGKEEPFAAFLRECDIKKTFNAVKMSFLSVSLLIGW